MIYLRGIGIDSGDATAIYYSGRKGWHFPCNLGGSPSRKTLKQSRNSKR